MKTEFIKCPECGHIQPAYIKETIIFDSYNHRCEQCDYLITESDWQPVKLKVIIIKTESVDFIYVPISNLIISFNIISKKDIFKILKNRNSYIKTTKKELKEYLKQCNRIETFKYQL